MAIVKMKKLRLMVVREQKEELLRSLQLLGCVQIDDNAELMHSEEFAPYLREESSASTEYRSELSKFDSALKLLDRYAPVKTALFAMRPVVDKKDFFDEDDLNARLADAEHLLELEAKLRSIAAEESRLRGLCEQLEPWRNLDLPLETSGTKRTSVFLGMLPAEADGSEIGGALRDAAPESELFEVSSDKEQRYVCLVCLKEECDDALEVLRTAGFTLSSLGTLKGTAAENIALLKEKLSDCREQKETAEKEVRSYAPQRENFKLCLDRMNVKIAKADAEARLVGTDSVLCLSGWLTAPEEKALADCLANFDCAWELEEPEESEYPDVPVQLRNNEFTEPLNMATNMYSLPAYGSIDPNPVMSVFFILFYGIMMADMGYGLIMILFALTAIKKSRPKGGRKYFFGLMLECGISTFIMGILSGGFFSNAIPTVYEMFGKECPIGFMTHPLIDPLNDTNTVLIGGMLLGVIHLFTGMFVNWHMKARDGHFMDGVWDEGTWMVLLFGLAFYFGPNFVPAMAKLETVGLVLLIVGGLMLIYGSGRNEKGIKKLTALGGAIYNGVTGWFGDILSYSRLMALMLAGSVVGQVFNTLAAMPSEGGVTPFSLIAFILIFLVGHAINFGLNILGCFAHDLRLQCLEFFGKFYQDGGKPFTPLNVNTKYVDVES